VAAYLLLMSDAYPSTDEEQYVHLDLDYPDAKQDLNRWLPLVKWLLAFPHIRGGLRWVDGEVPESTAVVLVTTPRSSFWQIPRGGVSFCIPEGSLCEALGFQLFDAAGVLLDGGTFPDGKPWMNVSDDASV